MRCLLPEAPVGTMPSRRAAAIALLVGGMVLATPVLAQQTGRASATGTDTLSLNGRSYQLSGIDALEFNQSCFIDGQPFACGAAAARALQTLLDPAEVTCTPTGAPATGLTPATCAGHDGDVGLGMIEQGWAVSDPSASGDYAEAEATARSSQVGAWRGAFAAPGGYRATIATVEAKYAERAGEAARLEGEEAIATGAIDLLGLEPGAPEFVEEAAGAPLEDHEIRFGAFAPGFIDAAIEPPEVFTWRRVAEVVEGTRRAGVDAVKAGVTSAIWEALAARPSQTVDTRNAADFHAALRAGTAEWIAAGRQPILFVMAQDRPSWIRDWFLGQAPTGAEVTRRDDRNNANYLGTIDGVDVYVGPGRDRAALLVPADILAGATFRRDADGSVLTLQVDANAWVLRYGMALRWLDDKPTWLTFPRMASPTPDA